MSLNAHHPAYHPTYNVIPCLLLFRRLILITPIDLEAEAVKKEKELVIRLPEDESGEINWEVGNRRHVVKAGMRSVDISGA